LFQGLSFQRRRNKTLNQVQGDGLMCFQGNASVRSKGATLPSRQLPLTNSA
jgi:hypothetical protein